MFTSRLMHFALFFALCGGLWAFQEWHVRLSKDILVVETGDGNHLSPNRNFFFLIAAGGEDFQVSDTIPNRLAFVESIAVGCRYRASYIDQSRYFLQRRGPRPEGRFITDAERLDCPGAPQKPGIPQVTARELLERLTR